MEYTVLVGSKPTHRFNGFRWLFSLWCLCLLLFLLLWPIAWHNHLTGGEAHSGSQLRVHSIPWWEGVMACFREVGTYSCGFSHLGRSRGRQDRKEIGQPPLSFFCSFRPSARPSSQRYHNLPKQLHPLGTKCSNTAAYGGRGGPRSKS